MNDLLMLLILLVIIGFIALDIRHSRKLKHAEQNFIQHVFEDCNFNECWIQFKEGGCMIVEAKPVDWDEQLKKLPRP